MLSSSLKNKLIHLLDNDSTVKAFVGFDGYIDFIQKAVKVNSKEVKLFYETLEDLGKHISSASGKSAQVELITLVKKLGGNGPIMSNALGRLGIKNYCVGSMGFPVIHDVYKTMHPDCELLSFAEPGISNALEFEDGKLILSELSAFDDLDFDCIQRNLDMAYFDQAIQSSRLIAMVDWANLPQCTSLWTHLFEHLTSLGMKDKIFFFDLCDPSKKTSEEIREIVEVIGMFTSLGTCVLGLNENEARKVFTALNQNIQAETNDLSDICEELFSSIQVDALLVHPVDCSILVTKDQYSLRAGKVISDPKLLTGGGDNLNAGFCFGLLHDCTWEECMQIGMATSGAYVRDGISPDIQTLITFMES